MLGHLIEFLERRPILGLPLRKAVRSTPVHHSRGCAWAGEFCVFVKKRKNPSIFHEDAVGDKLLPEGDYKWVALLRGGTILQERLVEPLEDDKSIWRALAARFSSLDAAKEQAARLLSRRVGQSAQEDQNQEQAGAAGCVIERPPCPHGRILESLDPPAWFCSSVNAYLLAFGEQTALKISHVGLG